MAAHVASQRIAADYDVLILGGGCAGLACYEALRAQDLRCAIVESKAFLGGRVRGFAGAEHHDAGAAWVHGASPANPQVALAAAAGVAVAETFPENPWCRPALFRSRAAFYRGGARVGAADVAAGGALHAAATRRVEARAAAAVAAGDAAATLAGALDYGGASGAAAFVARAHGTMMELWMGASARELQLREFEAPADDDSLCGDFPGAHGLPRGGMRGVLEPLLAAVPAAARLLGRRCVAVRTGAAGVRVETLGGDVYACRACVVALPLGVLRDAPPTFDPPLPAAKARAIARLGVGAYAKVLLRFERRWWRDGDGDVVPGFLVLEDGDDVVVCFDDGSDDCALEATFAGDAARACDAARHGRRVARVLAALERATGEAPPPPVAAHTTDWTNDPDARGAYSFWPAGAGDADVDDLAAPVDGRLFFAGEATSVEYQGSMAGALLSGARAAAEVLDAARGERALEHVRI